MNIQFVDDPPVEKVISETLFAEYDKLNAFWIEAERQLAALHTPAYCNAEYKRVDVGDAQCHWDAHYISWERFGKDWRLCYYTHDDNMNECYSRPIVECPADVRIDAVDAFPQLKAKLIEKAKAYVDKVKETNAKFAKMLG